MSRLTDDKKTLELVTASMADMDLSAVDDVRVMGLVNMAYETAWIRSERAVHEVYRVAQAPIKIIAADEGERAIKHSPQCLVNHSSTGGEE